MARAKDNQPDVDQPSVDDAGQNDVEKFYERNSTFAGRAGKVAPAPVFQPNSTFASRKADREKKAIQAGENKAVQESENK